MVYTEVYQLVVPTSEIEPVMQITLAPGFVHVFSGNIAATVTQAVNPGKGQRAPMSEKTSGIVEGYDYRDLYKVYDIAPTSNPDDWFSAYRHDDVEKAKEKLIRVFHQVESAPLSYEINATITLMGPTAFTLIYTCYRVIQLRMGGLIKNFIVTNLASLGAFLPDGSKFPGEFTVHYSAGHMT